MGPKLRYTEVQCPPGDVGHSMHSAPFPAIPCVCLLLATEVVACSVARFDGLCILWSMLLYFD